MLVPGELSVQSTLPVFLSMAMKLGAAGAGRLTCPSSTPFEVLTNSMSPAAVTEQLHMLCCETPSSLHHVEAPDDVGLVLVVGVEQLVARQPRAFDAAGSTSRATPPAGVNVSLKAFARRRPPWRRRESPDRPLSNCGGQRPAAACLPSSSFTMPANLVHWPDRRCSSDVEQLDRARWSPGRRPCCRENPWCRGTALRRGW